MRRSLRERARAIARIARWEAAHTVGTVDRRTAALGATVLLLSASLVGVAAATGGVTAPNEDIYRVGVAPESPYRDVVENSTPLAARAPDPEALAEGRLDLLVRDPDPTDRTAEVRVADSRKGQASLAAFRTAVRAANERLMARQQNRSAAFPVVVNLRYEPRQLPIGSVDGGADATTGGGGSDDGGADGGEGGDGEGGADGEATGGSGGGLGVPSVGADLFATDTTGSPADIDPPFPFASLLLAFAFLVPMNFVIQAYGSTVLDERINRRGELLLVAPVGRLDIVAGKTLPYALGSLLAVSAVAALVGGGPVSVAAAFPIALSMLAATFVGGMFARSFKELTFVTVAVSVFFTAYAFVPAIFTNVTPIALISPLSLVVRDLQGVAVTPVEYAFSTGPVYLSSGVMFLLGVGVYREEDMFTQRPVPLKALDALDARLSGPGSVAVLTALFIPFVFVAELLAVAVLFALPIRVSVPLLFVAIAVVEELAKSAHVLAGFEKGRFERSTRTALTLGGLSGLGFFLGEKATVVVQVVGIPELAVGRAAFGPAGVGIGPGVGLALLLAPLALHAVTAALSAVGAARGRREWAVGLVAAVAVHTVYNLAVVSALG